MGSSLSAAAVSSAVPWARIPALVPTFTSRMSTSALWSWRPVPVEQLAFNILGQLESLRSR